MQSTLLTFTDQPPYTIEQLIYCRLFFYVWILNQQFNKENNGKQMCLSNLNRKVASIVQIMLANLRTQSGR